MFEVSHLIPIWSVLIFLNLGFLNGELLYLGFLNGELLYLMKFDWIVFRSKFLFFYEFWLYFVYWLVIHWFHLKQWTWLNAKSLGSFDGICISVFLFSLGNWKLISLCLSVSLYWGMWICSNFVSDSCGFNFSLEIFTATSVVCPRADVAYCVQALAKRLGKTRSWMVCLSKYFGLLDDLFFH